MDQPLCNVFQLWTLADLDAIMAWMNTAAPRRAVVVGAGFVGLEVIEQLHRRGLEVCLVDRGPQVLGPLDVEMARAIESEILRVGVRLFLNAQVQKLETQGDRASAVELADGQRLECDLVIVGAGVRPRTELAQSAGLIIGNSGGVSVNSFMQTSDPLIYAVGDMAELSHGVLSEPQRIPLAGPANRGGRIAGTHAASGFSQPMGKTLGTAIVRVFNVAAATTGISERTCMAHGIDYRVATIQAADHASYYPGAKELTLKLIYAPGDGRILGAQVTGEAGVDKRIDVVATAMQFRGTVHDLAQLDLAYAPPFGSAKDPIHMVAFVAQNDLQSRPPLLACTSPLEGYQVVDVRNASEIERLPLAGARHIPIDELAARWTELDPALPTVVVCHSGKRAHVGACWLAGNGFSKVQNLNGGMSMRNRSVTQPSLGEGRASASGRAG